MSKRLINKRTKEIYREITQGLVELGGGISYYDSDGIYYLADDLWEMAESRAKKEIAQRETNLQSRNIML